MEDPYSDMEGGIEEYSSEESNGKVSWILKKGLAVGKKILLTGFVISTAPVVLPPLVVISVLGFACSVPYGLLFASYACTDKLMSKLLPGSKPPPFLLDYRKGLSSDEEVSDYEYGKGEDRGFKGGVGMEGEQEEEMLNDRRENVQEAVEDATENVEENGYEEDFGKYEGEKEEKPIKLEVEVRIDGVEEEEKVPVTGESLDQDEEMVAVVVDIEGDEKIGGTIEVVAPFEVTDMVVDSCQNTEIKEEEELMKETKGMLENLREEGMTDTGEKDKQSAEKLSGDAEEGNQQVNRNVVPSEDRVGSKSHEEETKNTQIPKESANVKETENVQSEDIIPTEKDLKESAGVLSGKKVTDNTSGAGKPTEEMIGTTGAGSGREEQKRVVNKPCASEGGGDDDITKGKEKDIRLNKEKEKAREIADESGFDLSAKNNAAAHSSTDYSTVEGEQESDTAGTVAREESGMASSKALDSEEKIWEQIGAMRRIVGYKAAAQATCIEELKALYLFTGVEPPALFRDPADLVEVNDKLRFLMSIVGVK